MNLQISPVSIQDKDAMLPNKAWPRFMQGAAQQNYLSAEDGVKEAARGGYSHWYIDGSLEGERPGDWTPERIASLRQCINTLGVKPIYHGNFKVPLGSDVAEMRSAALHYMRQEVDLCVALGGAPLIVHGGGIVEPRLVVAARKIGLDGLVSNLRELTLYAAERNVPIWLENLCNYTKFHPFYYIYTTPEEYAYVLDRVPLISFFLDVSHAHVNEGKPVQVFEKFADRIAAMSFSDNEGVRDSHFPLGEGNLDYPGLVESIIRHDWKGIIGFETRGANLNASVSYLNRVAERVSSQSGSTLIGKEQHAVSDVSIAS